MFQYVFSSRELQIALIEGMDVSGYAKTEISPELMFDRRKSPKIQKKIVDILKKMRYNTNIVILWRAKITSLS